MLKIRTRKKKLDKIEEARLHELMQQALGSYIKREELEQCLASIQRDEKRQKVWASLSTRKKLRVLRHALEVRASHGQKKT